MKKLNNKGFTLIELLAVIIVLAIVALVGYSSIGTILDSSKKQAFATEANFLTDAAQNAMTLIQLGEKVGKSNASGDRCFTLEALTAKSLFDKKNLNDSGYLGMVIVTVGNSGVATYTTSMKNADYSVSSITGAIKVGDVKDAKELDSRTLTCSGYDLD